MTTEKRLDDFRGYPVLLKIVDTDIEYREYYSTIVDCTMITRSSLQGIRSFISEQIKFNKHFYKR